MSRHPLPDQRSELGDSPFFPSFQKEMNRLIDQFRTGFPMPDLGSGFQAAVMPAIDVVETDGAVEISAEVPGVKEDDIEAAIKGDVLILKGEKSSEHEEGENDYRLIERSYGSFRRQIALGFTPDDDAVAAHVENGILKVRIQKPATVDMRKIDIKKS